MAQSGEMTVKNFHEYFDNWVGEQNQYLEQLIAAAGAYESRRGQVQNGTPRNGLGEEVALRQLVDRVIRHYEQYYNIKSRCETEDVLAVLMPSWRSKLEDAFLWIGGWRPSMAFMLLYSKLGLQVEAGLGELMRSVPTGDLADLSHDQIRRVDELQQTTIDEEKRISEKMAKQQQKVADSSMTELSHVVSEMMRMNNNDENRREVDKYNSERVEPVLKQKENELECVLHVADDLRLQTLRKVIEILSPIPIQGVHFLIAAAELHLRVHEWGTQKDAAAAAATSQNAA